MVTVWCHGGCARVCVCAPVRAVKLQPERRRALNGTSSSESPTVDGSRRAFKLPSSWGQVYVPTTSFEPYLGVYLPYFGRLPPEVS